ncbi:MAG: flagellar basal-body rod protein FlgG [Phycisphaeraceae bacterium]|nr:flagellar basal-body rod protein FlgG [Phycisphaeraceae bacterium]
MAVSALHSSATGLSALSQSIDIIANNLANVNTNGFKASRANFEDLLYDQKLQPGVQNANGDERPAGLQVGLGTRISNTQYDLSTGNPIPTERDLDLMVQGNGFFRVSILQEKGNGIGYTRAGNFFRNSEGDIVLGNTEGPRLDPPINLPEDATDISISADGQISYIPPGSTTATVAGQIQLSNFVNPNGLESIGGNIYVETPASGQPIEGNPGEGALGTILQGHLESSNVDPVKELVMLIKTQRAFEMNSQTIQAADEMLQVISNLRRV